MIRKFIYHKINQFLLHGFFWSLVLLFYTYFFGFNSNDFHYILSFSLFLMPITIATTYVFIYKVIPNYLITKKYFLFILYSSYTFIISAYLIVVSVFFGLIYLSKMKYNNMAPVSKSILFVFTGVYIVVIAVSAFKLLNLNLKQIEKSKDLQTKILEAQLKLKEQELKYLKTQIHPHFLFNTLNTIYGFALKKSDETPDIILKLSELLDYILYKVEKPLVSLNEEINHLRNYIELEKVRFKDTLLVDFNLQEIPNTIKIAPMLLLSFTENSFKHGSIKNNKLHIKIDIKHFNNQLNFYIENTYLEPSSKSTGIGLKNTKKRLDLLYPNKYLLDIKTENRLYIVNLKIDLS
ncbi:sensor histidine kinase [Wenyingzhuangia sp. IMCC45574]